MTNNGRKMLARVSCVSQITTRHCVVITYKIHQCSYVSGFVYSIKLCMNVAKIMIYTHINFCLIRIEKDLWHKHCSCRCTGLSISFFALSFTVTVMYTRLCHLEFCFEQSILDRRHKYCDSCSLVLFRLFRLIFIYN